MPLSHLKVIELATILAGPAVGMFLAELGAQVTKVENPRTGGDPTRGWLLPGEPAREGRSAYFCSVNWGKRSLCLDLKEPPDRARLESMLPETDVLLVNFKPGDDRRLGLDLARLQREYPSMIIGAVTGYGSDNPRPGFDALVQAESGFMTMNGPSGGPPCKLPVALVDVLAAHQLKEAILLALYQRERGLGGRLVSVSLWETALSSMVNQATNVLMCDHDPMPHGTEHPNLFPYGTLLPCRDGQLVLAVGTDRQFQQLCTVLEADQLIDEYSTNQKRNAGRERLRAQLGRCAAAWPENALLDTLLQAGVPCGRLGTVREALASPQGQALQLHYEALAGVRTSVFAPRQPLAPPPIMARPFGERCASIEKEGA